MNVRLARAFESVATAVLLVTLVAGCGSPEGVPNYTGTGALAGGVSGAGLGALIDHRNPGAGALIGGAAGAITGGLIGHSMDQQARRPVYIVSPPAAPPPPPPPMTETVVSSPGPGYVWISGQWVWNGRGWYWTSGYWAAAPASLTTWVPGGWVEGPRGRYWEPGHWQ